ncbi:MAG: hypothetical protein DHS20C15_33860 [Planctomycetota bacterium]|nr:MAG: hypothetical protein DHS20C15_33860 [Planctomycetota bacterium]
MLALLLVVGPMARFAEAGSGFMSLGSVFFFLFALGGFAIAYLAATLVSIRKACTEGPHRVLWTAAAWCFVAVGLLGLLWFLGALPLWFLGALR